MTSSNGVLSSELQVRVSMSNVHNSGNFISLHRLPLTIQSSLQSMPLDIWYFCNYICICNCFLYIMMSNVHSSGNFISLHSPQSMPLDLWYFCIYICICNCFCKLSYPMFTIPAISSLPILHRLTLTIQPSKYVLLPSVYFCIFVFVIKIIQHHVQSAEIWQFYLAANNPAITSK